MILHYYSRFVDELKQLWTPWRIEYVLMKKPKGCIFCKLAQDNRDESNYILYRGMTNFMMMNSYPYNNGHLVIAPYRHARDLSTLNITEFHHHIETVRLAQSLLQKAFNPDGFNIGRSYAVDAPFCRKERSSSRFFNYLSNR